MEWKDAMCQTTEAWRGLSQIPQITLADLRKLYHTLNDSLSEEERKTHQDQLTLFLKRVTEFQKFDHTKNQCFPENQVTLSARQVHHITLLLDDDLQIAKKNKSLRPLRSDREPNGTQLSSLNRLVFEPCLTEDQEEEKVVEDEEDENELKLMIQVSLLDPIQECLQGSKMISELTVVFLNWFSCVASLKEDTNPPLTLLQLRVLEKIQTLLIENHQWRLAGGGFDSSPDAVVLHQDLVQILNHPSSLI